MGRSESPELRPTLPDWAVVSPPRLQHIERVAELTARWALELGGRGCRT